MFDLLICSLHVLRHAPSAAHDVSVPVRDPSKLPAEAREHVAIHTGDLSVALRSDLVRGNDALMNCAGNVADGEPFVSLVDNVIASLESLPLRERPVCWLLAGAALPDVDFLGTSRHRAAPGEIDLLAARRQLRAPGAIEYRLAPAVPAGNPKMLGRSHLRAPLSSHQTGLAVLAIAADSSPCRGCS